MNAPTSKPASKSTKEQAEPLLRLLSSVPHSQQVKAPGKHATLKNAEEEPRHQQPRVALNQPLANRHDSESKTADTQPNTRGELLEKDVGWDRVDLPGVGSELRGVVGDEVLPRRF